VPSRVRGETEIIKKTLRGENMKYLVGCIISLFGGNLQKCCGLETYPTRREGE